MVVGISSSNTVSAKHWYVYSTRHIHLLRQHLQYNYSYSESKKETQTCPLYQNHVPLHSMQRYKYVNSCHTTTSHADIFTYKHLYIQTCILANINTYRYPYMQTSMNARINKCMAVQDQVCGHEFKLKNEIRIMCDFVP